MIQMSDNLKEHYQPRNKQVLVDPFALNMLIMSIDHITTTLRNLRREANLLLLYHQEQQELQC